ncbi:MAG: amino acid ABC transporter substrate-binding protein [Microvirga sp.]|nr:amino acid ABC transporter substrate-binding protein [Microvirga sp.]
MTGAIYRRFVGLSLILGLGLVGAPAHAQTTLDAVRERGAVICGVNSGLAGFSTIDAQGRWTGFDVDYCRAIASAIFGDPERARFEPVSARERFLALREGDVDVLLRNSTATMERDVALELDFPAINYYDGQGFLVRKDLGVSSARELNGATVCVQNGTTTRLNLGDFFRQNGIRYEAVVFDSAGETVDAYLNRRCDAFTTDASGLYAQRVRAVDPDNHVVLPEVISKEPLGPAVRQEDARWADLVRWVHFAMINAEEHGVTSQNVDDRRNADQAPAVRRLLGVEGDFGRMLGLDENWAYNVVKQIGNYGEVYARNIGEGSPLRIQRGLNALWTRGGLQYGHPIR